MRATIVDDRLTTPSDGDCAVTVLGTQFGEAATVCVTCHPLSAPSAAAIGFPITFGTLARDPSLV